MALGRNGLAGVWRGLGPRGPAEADAHALFWPTRLLCTVSYQPGRGRGHRSKASGPWRAPSNARRAAPGHTAGSHRRSHVRTQSSKHTKLNQGVCPRGCACGSHARRAGFKHRMRVPCLAAAWAGDCGQELSVPATLAKLPWGGKQTGAHLCLVGVEGTLEVRRIGSRRRCCAAPGCCGCGECCSRAARVAGWRTWGAPRNRATALVRPCAACAAAGDGPGGARGRSAGCVRRVLRRLPEVVLANRETKHNTRTIPVRLVCCAASRQ
jgi:hypothetical protein